MIAARGSYSLWSRLFIVSQRVYVPAHFHAVMQDAENLESLVS
jgi:hypothetical protein